MPLFAEDYKEQPHSKLRFKALKLLVKIFGLTSFLLPQNSWLKYVHHQQGYSLISATKEEHITVMPQHQQPPRIIALAPNLALHVPYIQS